jgi:2-polyprenyl-3-methyl-5-hydroxy-6-metoxy-1,4-benzoquinol methylase
VNRPGAERYTWPEMRRYWETHHTLRANVDWSNDPDGLDNVCHAGAPAWLNAYYARWQRNVYRALLSLLPDETGRRALEVGCGAGRWCRLLFEQGYDVTGIDLQSALISHNREHHPAMDFHCCSLQEYEPDTPFHLVSSVTVLQHIPFGEQIPAVQKVRSTLIDGGHAIVLENIRDQAAHVFSRSIADWTDLFVGERLEVVTVRRYDYNPTLRAIGLGRRLGRRVLRRSNGTGAAALNRGRAGRIGYSPKSAHSTPRPVALAQRVAVSVDSRLETPLVRRNVRLPTVHAGLLLRAV